MKPLRSPWLVGTMTLLAFVLLWDASGHGLQVMP